LYRSGCCANGSLESVASLSPIFGMPILKVSEAKSVLVLKRGSTAECFKRIILIVSMRVRHHDR